MKRPHTPSHQPQREPVKEPELPRYPMREPFFVDEPPEEVFSSAKQDLTHTLYDNLPQSQEPMHPTE